MPTRKEVENYKERVERLLQVIVKADINDDVKDELINRLLNKWEMCRDALEGLGFPIIED